MSVILRRDPRVLPAVTAAMCVLATAHALAQSSVVEALPSEGTFRSGPVVFFPTLVIRDAGIDQNVLSGAESRQDYTYTLAPRLRAAMPWGPVRISGVGETGYIYYRRYAEQRSMTARGGLRVDTPDGPVRPFAEAQYARTRDRSDIDVLQRTRQTLTGGLAGVDVPLTPITTLTAWVERFDVTYDAREVFRGVSLGTQLDHGGHVVAGGARYALTPLTTIVGAIEHGQYRFTQDSLRDADTLRVAPRVLFAEGGVLQGQLSAGYLRFTPLNRALRPLSGVAARGRVAYTLLGATRFEVEADRDVDFSFDATQPYYWRTSGRAMVSHRLVGPLDLVVVGERRLVRYHGFTGQPFQAQVDRISDAGAGVGIHVSEDLRLTVVYDAFERRSTGHFDGTFRRRRVLAAMTVFPE